MTLEPETWLTSRAVHAIHRLPMLTLRLARAGTKKRPVFHLVAADSRSRRDGRFVENLGYYIPGRKVMVFKHDRIDYWLNNGATQSETAKRLILKAKKHGNAEPIAKPKYQPPAPKPAEAKKEEPKPEAKADAKPEEKPAEAEAKPAEAEAKPEAEGKDEAAAEAPKAEESSEEKPE